MGYTTYDHDTYRDVTSKSAFTYDRVVHDSGIYTVHPTLDLKGVRVRECRDSAEHPNSRGIVVVLDGTGSNRDQARIVHEQLPTLMGLIVRQGVTSDPHIMVMVVGDASDGDLVPIQGSQFESGNEIDLALGNMILEGGGGGGIEESYELPMYFLARHTSMDCIEKRGQKGHVFIVGDEQAYPRIRREQVNRLLGDDLQGDIPTETIVKELLDQFEVTFIVPRFSQHGKDHRIEEFWRNYFGQNVYVVDDAHDIVPLIAAQVLVSEDVDESTIVSDLKATGTSDRALALITSSLANRPKSAGLATVEGSFDIAPAASGTTRL